MNESGEEIGTNSVEEENVTLEEEDGAIEIREENEAVTKQEQENATDSEIDKTSEKQGKEQVEALTEEDEELDEIQKLFQEKDVQIDRAVVKMISRMPIAMRILRFMYNNGGDYYRQELRKKLNLPDSTAAYNLRKLENSGIIAKFIPGPVNLRVRCFRIVNMQLASLVIKRFLWLCSFRLSKTVPFNPTSIEKLQKTPEFVKTARKYHLSFDEAIEALKLNRREIQPVYSESYSNRGALTGFQRIPVDEIRPLEEG